MISRDLFNEQMKRLVEDIFERDVPAGKIETIFKHLNRHIHTDKQLLEVFERLETYNGRSAFPKVADFNEVALDVSNSSGDRKKMERILTVVCPTCDKTMAVIRDSVLNSTDGDWINCPNSDKDGNQCSEKIFLSEIQNKMKHAFVNSVENLR